MNLKNSPDEPIFLNCSYPGRYRMNSLWPTYGESVIWTHGIENSESTGPRQKNSTSISRPAIESFKSERISSVPCCLSVELRIAPKSEPGDRRYFVPPLSRARSLHPSKWHVC